MGSFVNFSNHSSDKWGIEQFNAAREYGEIIDIPFPILEKGLSEDDIENIGNEYIARILEHNPVAVMCQGEFTLTFYVVCGLLRQNVTCLSACSQRISKETVLEDGRVQKESLFVFDKFRRFVGGNE